MKFRLINLFFFLLVTKFVVAQDFQNYKTIKNIGTLPDEFTLSLDELYKKDIDNEKTKIDKKVKFRDKKEFILESNFAISELLRSGKILFNSPINTYVNKVVDNILKANPNIDDNIKIYIVQSPSFNAFTFNDGKIFVNMGMLAYLKNEAQLAFILSHEISHYIKAHSLNIFIERKKINKGVNEYENFDESDKIFATNSFSKEQEIEADAEGLRIFSKTGYNLDEAKTALELLKYSEQPFENKKFSTSFFNRPYMNLPSVFFPDSSYEGNSIGEKDFLTDDESAENDDKNSTHPSIDKRIRTLDKVNLGKSFHEGGEKYIISEKEFFVVRNMARFELCRLYLLAFKPLENLYNIYVLESEFPNNKYLLESKLKSLYQIITAVNKGYKNSVVLKSDKVESELKKIHNLFRLMSKEEISAVCLRLGWEIKLQLNFAEKDQNNLFLEGIVFSFANNINAKYSYFKGVKDYNDSVIQSYYKIVSENRESKSQKRKSKFGNENKLKRRGTFANFVMIPYLDNNEFKNYFMKVCDKIDEKTKEDEDTETEFEKTKASIKITKAKNLGIKKLVFIDPDYIVIDQRKEQSKRYIESENKKLEFKKTITKCMAAAKIEADFIVPSEIKNSEEYNEFATVKSRMSECFQNENLKPIASDLSDISSFAENHNTEYVATLINIALTDAKDPQAYLYGCLISVLSYGLYLPFVIYYLSVPDKSNALILAVYNIKSGEIKYGNIVYSTENDNDDLIASELYNLIVKIK